MNKEKRYYNLNENINRITKNNNELLNEINKGLNNDPVLNMFAKGNRKNNILKFVITTLIMAVLFFIIYKNFYKDVNFLDKSLDILGNGFYLLFYGYVYIWISKIFNRLGGKK